MALFFVLVAFFLVTAITANTQRELTLTRRAAVETQRVYLALGAVNEAIALLAEGQAWETYPADSPLRLDRDGVQIEAFYVEDEINPGLLHVTARVFPAGQPNQAVWRTRVVRKASEPQGAVYSMHWGSGAQEIPSVMTRTSQGGDWKLLPNPGSKRMLGIAAGNNTVYAAAFQLPPLFDAIGLQMFRDSIVGQVDGIATWDRVFTGLIMEDAEAQALFNFPLDWSISRYDVTSNSWREVLSLGSGEIGGRPCPTDDGVYMPTVGRSGGGKIYHYSENSGTTTQIPAPPAQVYTSDGSLGSGGKGGITALGERDGTLFASATYENGSAVYQQNEQGGWDRLPPVPRMAYLDGQVVTKPGVAHYADLVGVTTEGEPVVVYKGGLEQYVATNRALYSDPDGMMVLRNGQWELLTPPPAGTYDSAGNYTPGQGHFNQYHSVSVDVEGRIVASLDGPVLDVLQVYDKGEWSVMPPAPREYNQRVGGSRTVEGQFQPDTLELSAGGVFDPSNLNRYSPVSTY
ncbi:MAG: hypothetical protein AB7S38_05780 [Vulcanimicrobiota bacterium]